MGPMGHGDSYLEELVGERNPVHDLALEMCETIAWPRNLLALKRLCDLLQKWGDAPVWFPDHASGFFFCRRVFFH